MDIYSATRRLGAPFTFTADSRAGDLPIGAHGLIGDGLTAALVRIDGAITWLCFPSFDSPSVFAGLLDPARGGTMSVTPAARPFGGYQRYDPGTNVLETLFDVDGQGTVRLTDYMPWTGDARARVHEVHRRVECRDGEVELEIVFDPRFDYGQHEPRFRPCEDGVLAQGPQGQRLALSVSRPCFWGPRAGGGLSGRLKIRAGERVWCVLAWDAPEVVPITAHRPFEHLRSTRRYWREWSHHLQYDGPWRHHVLRSALVLKLLQYGPTGAIVAAPTTSLPERVGGVRNWDYRYVWTRDAALCIRAMNLIGYSQEPRDFFHFVRDGLDSHKALHIFYTVSGGLVPEERTLPWLAGFQASSPVRIGNDAREQLQLDNAGYLLDAAFAYERFGNVMGLRLYRLLMNLLDTMKTAWREPDHGIWEPRGVVRHNVHSKAMMWVAFERGARLATVFGDESRATDLRRQAEAISAEVFGRGLDPTGTHFVADYGGTEADATLLLLPAYGLLPPDDPRAAATVEFVRERLLDRGFLLRYRQDDGLPGGEGAFILCGFWLVEALALMGRLDEAQEFFVRHAEASNHVGLLSEEIDPGSGVLLGNFPQAFSHMGLIQAAARVDLALRLRDERSRQHPIFRLDSYLD